MSDWVNDRTFRDHAPTAAGTWRVVVPVKGGPGAKSRLRAPDGVDRVVLARALALDTVTAAVEAVGPDHVVVVTSDRDVVAAVRGFGRARCPTPTRDSTGRCARGSPRPVRPPGRRAAG